LPSDWKALVEAYGYGTFADFFHLWSPFFTACTMMSQARGALDADRTLAASWKGAVPFPLFPESGGALPWGRSDNGDVAYWLTKGKPDAWTVAIWNARGGERFHLVKGGALAFLEGWLGGKQRIEVFPNDIDFRDGGRFAPCFDAWIERAHFTIDLEPPPEGSYAKRFATLTSELAPVTMRGGFGDEGAEKRQAHFMARGTWKITYDTVYGHNLRVSVPKSNVKAARAELRKAVEKMGLRTKPPK
jgi:hypothetical protein